MVLLALFCILIISRVLPISSVWLAGSDLGVGILRLSMVLSIGCRFVVGCWGRRIATDGDCG